jgi:predicted CoA-binding protein
MQQVVSERMTAVLGASIKRERYSNQALRMLREHGYRVIAVHPAHVEIEGEQTVPIAGGNLSGTGLHPSAATDRSVLEGSQ